MANNQNALDAKGSAVFL